MQIKANRNANLSQVLGHVVSNAADECVEQLRTVRRVTRRVPLHLHLPDILNFSSDWLRWSHLRALPSWWLDVLNIIFGFYLYHSGLAIDHFPCFLIIIH